MSLVEIKDITGGEVSGGDARFSAVSIDTRTLRRNDLFIAIEGENFNGNRFVTDAAAKGAAGAIVTDAVDVDLPRLRVEDSRLALGQLGALNRERSRAKVIALTGSQGKTTVKEMLARILSECGEVLATRGNLNNDYGVPLTLLRINDEHDFAVMELGANAPGEIAYTAALVRPDIAHITNAAPTHLEGFGDLDGVARAKGEIWGRLGPGGIAVVNLDDAYANAWRRTCADGVKVCTVSARGNKKADYYLSNIRFLEAPGSSFTLHGPQGAFDVVLNLAGHHNAANALAAAALALEAGAGADHVIAGLRSMDPVPGRLFYRQGPAGSVLIDDSYNASPASFRAAIDVLAERPGQRILAMGDMGELGTQAEAAHRGVGEYAVGKGIDVLLGIGPLTALAVAGFGANGESFASLDDMAASLSPRLREGVTVLVKGSRSAGMERLLDRILSPVNTYQED